jgi:hypothetical protein
MNTATSELFRVCDRAAKQLQTQEDKKISPSVVHRIDLVILYSTKLLLERRALEVRRVFNKRPPKMQSSWILYDKRYLKRRGSFQIVLKELFLQRVSRKSLLFLNKSIGSTIKLGLSVKLNTKHKLRSNKQFSRESTIVSVDSSLSD